jgi:hypothetical protein
MFMKLGLDEFKGKPCYRSRKPAAMNLLISILLLFVFNQNPEYLTITGKIVQQDTNEPVSYVNIGVVRTHFGAVSDENGHFQITVPERLFADSLRFSIIGYYSRSFLISDLMDQEDLIIELTEQSYTMESISVGALRLREKRVGHRATSKRIVTGWGGRPDGGERGIRIKVDDKPIYPKKLSFHIASSDLDKVLFRINFRSIENEIPAESLLSEDILIETDQKEGWVEVDLEPYNLSFSEDVAVILQPVRSWGECRGSGHCLHLSASILQIFSPNWLYGKDGSEGDWVVSKNYSPAISLIVYQ